ncbi:MAG: 50S ribosomal protein L4 [Limisphaerales bacterium]|jgi:large subunit ribosomal protein L4|nr:50S ribosomal protein L4 [Pedosphaera sp.]MBL6843988.1 50S ribosomal protein L4 [Verrucomicrobiae bacterium]RZO72995.1 MAG: 50S ribosomal protein L4 [Limisphaerales bacterium]HAR00368.1 50S ribosomal protein L4 [Verrucomicrobiales bacterium]HCP39574.1 50S ribosomal protein L4 [Verrucomicrobiales bacterium]|tara:strand:- start:58 stop:681 length:624 start_codon:yes stop_codon:yes gene_type:complete
MKINVQNTNGESVEEMEVPFTLVEEGDKGLQAVHDTVVAYMASQRSGTACAKTRSEVAGTGKKPWRQKGTGRARAGSFQSPIWRGGGVVFGPRPRDFRKDVNKKTRKLALQKALTERIKSGEVLVVDQISIAQPKTKDFISILDNLKVDGTALLVTNNPDQNLQLSTRNVSYVGVTTSESLNTYDTLKYDRIIITRDAFNGLQSRLS